MLEFLYISMWIVKLYVDLRINLVSIVVKINEFILGFLIISLLNILSVDIF